MSTRTASYERVTAAPEPSSVANGDAPPRPVVVLHVVTSLGDGGAQAMLYKLLRGLDVNAFRCEVVSLIDGGVWAERIRSLDIPVHSLAMRPGRPSLGALLRLRDVIQRLRPDVVQSWLYHADLLAIAAAGISRPRPPVAWNIRCSKIDLQHYSAITTLVLRLLAATSSFPATVVVNSLAGQVEHQRLGFRPRRWAYIPNGFDTDLFRPNREARLALRQRLDIPDDVLLAGFVARVDPMKGHPLFLEALAKARAQGVDLRGVLVGAGAETSNPELAHLLDRFDLGTAVSCLGPHEEMHRIYPAFDINCLASTAEGFPNILGEAMSCAVPCVATQAGDSESIIGPTGYIAAPRTVEAYAAALVAAGQETAEARENRGIEARRRIESLYSIKAISRTYAALYDEVSRTPR